MSQRMAQRLAWCGFLFSVAIFAAPKFSFGQAEASDRRDRDRRSSASAADRPVTVFRQRVPVSPAGPPRVVVVSPGFGYAYPYYSDSFAYPYGFPYSLGVDATTLGPFYYPPVFADGQQLFGPQAVQRFMGVNPVPGPAAAAAPAVRPQPKVAEVPAGLPPSDAKARAKAWRQIDQGDADFAQNRFAQAIEHYRNAAAAARDVAETIFRQGHVLAAEGKYADAVKQYRRGLEIDPDWPTSDFQLDQLFGENKFRKAALFRTMERALAAHPHDPDLLIVLGVWHYFDSQKDAAADEFHRAAALLAAGTDDPFAGFLKNLPAAKHAVPPAPAANPPRPAAAAAAGG
jgi:tetratricopeptide (TPR) repeat protein